MLFGIMHLTVDLDNLWIYEQEYGSSVSGRYDLLFDEAMPRMLKLFARHNALATLFVVGRDLERPSCQEFCREAVRAGHEIANHSYSHAGNWHRLSFNEKYVEIMRAHELIEKHVGVSPVGFRGPGYYLDLDMVKILLQEGYRYDSSVLPSFANQLMQLYILLRTGRKIDKVFGRKRWIFASQKVTKIHHPDDPHKFLYELPISTAPYIRWPIHTTFLYMFGTRYLELVLPTLRSWNHGVYVFHGIDTLDYQQDEKLSKMVLPLKKPLDERIALIEWLLNSFKQEKFETSCAGLDSLEPSLVARSLLLNGVI